MKNIQFSKKTKVLLSLGTGLLATTSVVTPLVCSSCAKSVEDPLKEFDKQFHVDDYTIKCLQQDCETKYEEYLRTQKHIVDEHDIAEKKASLLDNINNLIKINKKQANGSATAISDAIIDAMWQDFGIKVSRRFDASINFNLEINAFRQTCNDAIVRMMNERKIPSSTISAKINNFNTEFGKLRTQLSAKYEDGLSIFTNIKAEAASLLDGISDELDQVAAASAFKKFFERYQFVVNEEKVKSTPTLCWNNIHKKYHDDENVSQFAKNVFRIYDKNEKTYKDIDKATDFEDGTIIANHRVEPLWRGTTEDMYSNKYTFSLEWRIIKIDNYNRYKATGDENIYYNTAASMSSVKDSSGFTSERDILKLPTDKKNYSIYDLPITAKFEQDQLKKAYGQIHLGWDDGQGGQGSMANCAYEGYFGFESKGKQALTDTQIGAIGLTVGSAQTNSVTRLDALQQQVKSKLSAGADFDSLSLEEKFVDSVDLVTFSEVTNDKKHIVDNKFYAAYKNSPYADPSDSQKTYTYFDDWDSHFEGMPISKNLYDTTWKNFRNSNEEAANKNLKRAEDLKTESTIIFWIFFGVAAILTIIVAVSIIYCLVPSLKIKASNALCAVCASVSLGFNAAATVPIGISKARISKLYDAMKEAHDDKRYQDYASLVLSHYNNYLHSYDTFKSSPMSDIKPIVSYYSSLQLQSEYQDFCDSRRDAKADEKEINEISRIINITLLTSTISSCASIITTSCALDIAHRIAEARKAEFWRQAEEVSQQTYSEVFQKLKEFDAAIKNWKS